MPNLNPLDTYPKQARHRVLKSGEIVSHNLTTAVGVTIHDLSADGALVRVSAISDFPESFNLLVVAEGLLYPATARWRKGEWIGIQFVGEPHHMHRHKSS